MEWLNKWRIQKLLTEFRLLAAMGSATKAQVAEAFGADTFGAAIVPARTPMLGYEKLLPAPESAMEAVPELECDQTAKLGAADKHISRLPDWGLESDPILKLEYVWAVVC